MDLITKPYSGHHGGPEVVLVVAVQSMFADDLQLTLTYAPDRTVVALEALQGWLIAVSQGEFASLEALATAVADGFYDAVLPKMLTVVFHAPGQTVTLQRAQPKL